jgi:hypothetical protein
MANDYKNWVREIPVGWKGESAWLKSHYPIAITSRYGQNQPINQAGTFDVESDNWFQDRDFTKIKWVSFAAATDAM